MIFPIGDTNVKGGFKPLFSYSLIVINIAMFLLQVNTEGNLVCDWAVIPQDINQGRHMITVVTSMFLHGGWMHLIGNMLFLWIFADNIEAVSGNIKFIFFYLLGGIVSALVHIIIEINVIGGSTLDCCMPCTSSLQCSDMMSICAGYVPTLGASGAISAVMGAYIVMFPTSRIKMLFLVFTFHISAIYFLGFWFIEQIISGMGTFGALSEAVSGGVAWWAHIGGFVFGLIYGFLNRGKMDIQQKSLEQ
jgi:membrane associated rhomboid family serine protease